MSDVRDLIVIGGGLPDTPQPFTLRARTCNRS